MHINIVLPPPIRFLRRCRQCLKPFTLIALLAFTTCKKDVVEPEESQLKPRSSEIGVPKAGFYNGYYTSNDNFKNYVVGRLQQLDQTAQFTGNFLTTKGMPLWNMGTTKVYSGYVLLLVPVKHPTLNKINALMAFIGRPTSVTFTTFALGRSYDGFSKIEDFYALYNQFAYGTMHPNISKYFKPVRNDGYTDDLKNQQAECFEVWSGTASDPFQNFLYDFCIGGEGGTWTYTIYIPSTIPIGLGWIPTASGGGNPVGPGGGATPINKNTELKTTRKELERTNCPNKALLLAVWDYVSFWQKPDLNSNGAYDPTNDWIIIKGLNIVDNSTILHELFHAYQNYLTPNGDHRTQWAEFETWIFTDIWLDEQGLDSKWKSRLTNSLARRYENWISDIVENGHSAYMNDYAFWFNEWKRAVGDVDYSNYPLGNQTTPVNITNLYAPCGY